MVRWSGRWVLGGPLLITSLLVAQPARANGWDAIPPLIRAVEIAIPDLRVEFTPERTDVVLSWPIQLVVLPELNGAVLQPSATVLFEPQWVPRQKTVRGLAGTRWYFGLGKKADFALVSDLGGVFGKDGVGLVTGAGLGATQMGDDIPATFLVLAYRYVWLMDEPRHDISLDLLMIPF